MKSVSFDTKDFVLNISWYYVKDAANPDIFWNIEDIVWNNVYRKVKSNAEENVRNNVWNHIRFSKPTPSQHQKAFELI